MSVSKLRLSRKHSQNRSRREASPRMIFDRNPTSSKTKSQDCWSARCKGSAGGDGNVNCGDDNGEGRGESGEEGDKETAIWNSRTL